MQHKHRARSSSLFLIELILAILFFSIASAICVPFFVKSHLLSQHSRRLTQAVNVCSSIAEICRTSETRDEVAAVLKQEYPQLDSRQDDAGSSELLLYFDEDFRSCKQDFAVCELHLTLRTDSRLLFAEMEMLTCSDQTTLYELEVCHHIPRRIRDEE